LQISEIFKSCALAIKLLVISGSQAGVKNQQTGKNGKTKQNKNCSF
jgi:hypothetical protein